MITRKHILACAAMTGLLGLGLAVAQAQPQQQPSEDQYLGRLHYDLRLRPEQEGAWQTFQQSYREDPRQEDEERDAEQRMPRMNGPQRMDMAIHMAERDLENLRRQGDALKAFYAQLSQQQQRTFDRDTLQPPDQQQGGYQGQGNYQGGYQGQGNYQGGYQGQGGYRQPYQGQGNYPRN